MDTRTIVIGIVLSLIVGAGYTLSTDSTSSPELERQIEEHQSNIRILENEKSDLQASLTSAMNTNSELQTTLISTESENTELQNILSEAKVLFESIESQLSVIQGGFGSPDYDSGWTPIEAGEKLSLTHGLGTKDDLFVYAIGRYSGSETNQLYYGL